MKILGIAGWSGAGKTSLLVELLPALIARGLTVSTVKHAHHEFEVDKPGKDSHRHREAGASEVLISSARRLALIREHGAAGEPTLAELLARLSPVDLVLVEGFKHGDHEKLEVHRPALGHPLLAAEDGAVIAVATDAPIPGLSVPALPLDDVARIADFIVEHLAARSRVA